MNPKLSPSLPRIVNVTENKNWDCLNRISIFNIFIKNENILWFNANRNKNSARLTKVNHVENLFGQIFGSVFYKWSFNIANDKPMQWAKIVERQMAESLNAGTQG